MGFRVTTISLSSLLVELIPGEEVGNFDFYVGEMRYFREVIYFQRLHLMMNCRMRRLRGGIKVELIIDDIGMLHVMEIRKDNILED